MIPGASRPLGTAGRRGTIQDDDNERSPMKNALLFVWLLIPVAIGAYHYGPGQDRLRSDRAAAAVARAEAAAKTARELAATEGDDAALESWAEAEAAWSEAIGLLPAGHEREARPLRLERAKAQMYVSKLPDARHDLEALVGEIAADPTAAPQELNAAREALANAQFYMTWLMRLEGAPREEWEPEIEASRQNYKLIAEDPALAPAGKLDEKVASLARENLESSIRLERMSLSDLQGLPLPSQ
jgi:hypothetical protein